MHALAVFDVVASMYIDKVAKLYSEIVSCDFVHLNPALFHIIRAEADKYCVSAFLAATREQGRSTRSNHKKTRKN
jgi:hypothetical protein